MTSTTIKSHDLEALRALRAIRHQPAEDFGIRCIKCTSDHVVECDEGPDFYCKDCGQTWLVEQQIGE